MASIDATDVECLGPEQVRAREKLKKLIEEQGAKPVTVSELRAMGDVWPEDENVDDFLAWREELRRAARDRSLA